MTCKGKWVAQFVDEIERDVVEMRLDDEEAQRYRINMNRTLARDLAELGDARDAIVRDIHGGLRHLLAWRP